MAKRYPTEAQRQISIYRHYFAFSIILRARPLGVLDVLL